MKVGKATKIFLAVFVTIVLLNVVYFAFHASIWLGLGASVGAGLIGWKLYGFIKKPPTKDGRFW